MSPPRAGRGRAEASAETRAKLLEAGARLLRDQPVGDVLNQVKAAEVARMAGLTIGAFYHHWRDQESYQRELVEFVLAPARLTSTSATVRSVQSDTRQAVPMEELVRRNARANFDSARSNPYLSLSLSLWGKQGDDEQIRDLLGRLYRSISAELVPMYQALFDEQGWEPRPPFTVEMFAVTLTALVEGLVIRAAVDPDAVPMALPTVQSAASQPLDGQLDQGEWDLFSILVLSLIPSMTVPKVKRDSELWLDHEDIRGVVRRLRENWEFVTGNVARNVAPERSSRADVDA